jgi:hypothetical protein
LAVLWGLIAFHASQAIADGVGVPPTIQAQIISKVPAYDRGFKARAGDRVHVLIVSQPKSAESVRVANYVKAALEEQDEIAGLPHDVTVSAYEGAPALVEEVRRQKITVLYVTPGFYSELGAICDATAPLGALTVTAVPEYVRRCVVLGFQVVSGKPKLLVHLEQAKKNGIRFSSELLKLAKVYR